MTTPAKRLIRLPNGDWIDPRTIDSVKVFPLTRGPGDPAPDRVIVRAGDDSIVILCESHDAAEELRDRIATAVNGGEWEP